MIHGAACQVLNAALQCRGSYSAGTMGQPPSYAAPRNPFTFLPPCQGVDCKPGRRHILHWPMSARGRKLYPPQKGSLPPVSAVQQCNVHGSHLPAVHLYLRTRWKSGGGLLLQ